MQRIGVVRVNKEEIDIIKEMIKERQEEINRVEDYVNTGLEEEELQALQNALNYIDKLQKENEELKDDNIRLCAEISDLKELLNE
jgi:cell division protein FtsB